LILLRFPNSGEVWIWHLCYSWCCPLSSARLKNKVGFIDLHPLRNVPPFWNKILGKDSSFKLISLKINFGNKLNRRKWWYEVEHCRYYYNLYKSCLIVRNISIFILIVFSARRNHALTVIVFIYNVSAHTIINFDHV
jgi:hypothetical protein